MTLQHPVLAVEESHPAHNYGYAISDSGTVTSVTSDVGAITFHPQWGLWQWNVLTTDGPTECQAVTITAIDDQGASNSVTFQLEVINVAPSITLHTPTEAEYQGVVFPLGDLSFADAVHEFLPGTNTTFLDATQALGAPEGGANDNGVTLGNGGSITLSFTDTPLVDQDAVANGADLFVFDLGYDSEAALIEISTDGLSWTALPGLVSVLSGEPKGIDIAAVAEVGAEYHFVRITDVFLDGEYDPNYVGPDIDAVGVIGHGSPIVVNGGDTATHSGSFREPGIDTVSISASMGSVTQSGNNVGEWSWSLPTSASASGVHVVTITATDADGGTSTASFDLICVASVVDVEIAVRPFGGGTAINLNALNDTRANPANNLIPVAIFSTSTFDATTVDLSTVVFAGASVARHQYRDIDGDGDRDLVAYFKLQDTNLFSSYRELLQTNRSGSYQRDVEVTLSGKTTDGIEFEGHDIVQLFASGRTLKDLLDSV